jgi:hypothetical protein
MVKVLVLRRPLQGALYLLPLFLHLPLEAIHVLLALFALFLHRSPPYQLAPPGPLYALL